MLEKNSHVVLTDDDLKLYNSGVVSERIKQTWQIDTIEELRELMQASKFNSNYKVSSNES
jgi:hypothetical protein